jgi:hypothetical protein
MFDIGLSNIFQDRQAAESRSISAENPTGARGGGAKADPQGEGPARDLGVGWKVRPCISLQPGETVTLMDTAGPGVIRHMWYTFHQDFYRDVIIRIYWDGQDAPSVQAPLGDFLCNCWNLRQNVLAQAINVNPSGGMNIYFPMPFREHARITVENRGPKVLGGFFYTINYTLEPVDDAALYFHAYWRRDNPLAYKTEYTIVDDIRGRGQFVGVFLAWQQNNRGWWGEGEVKMFLDGDGEYPTICGTGTEDYFGGAWGFGDDFSAPYLGYRQVVKKSGEPGCRMTLYRFHILDPVFFKHEFRMRIQALGWRSEGRFLALQDDLASVAYWYQSLPHNPFPPVPARDELEII